MVSNGDQIVSMPSQCKIANRISGWTLEEVEANAKLMAAAPDLMEALCELVYSIKTRYSVGSDLIHQLIKAEQAIKKATE